MSLVSGREDVNFRSLILDGLSGMGWMGRRQAHGVYYTHLFGVFARNACRNSLIWALGPVFVFDDQFWESVGLAPVTFLPSLICTY